MPDCEHDWQWGEGRNAGSAECRKCRTWQPASSIAYYLTVERNRYRRTLERIDAWDPRDGEDPRHWARDALRGYSVDASPEAEARVRERFGVPK